MSLTLNIILSYCMEIYLFCCKCLCPRLYLMLVVLQAAIDGQVTAEDIGHAESACTKLLRVSNDSDDSNALQYLSVSKWILLGCALNTSVCYDVICFF